jgi:hypothetical protein
MFFIINSTAFKTNVIFKKLDDWNEWIIIINTMIKRDDVERYVNLIKIESVKSIEFDFSIFFTIKIDVINSTDLSIKEQRDLAILQEDYKNQMCKYKKKNPCFEKSEHFHTDVSWSIQFDLSQKSKNDLSKIINFKKTFRVDELNSKTRDYSQI